MRYRELPEDYILVLRQIFKDGGDDMDDLAETVRIDYHRLSHIIASLHHKGLITVRSTGYDTWLNLSAKGQRLIRYIRPDMHPRYA